MKENQHSSSCQGAGHALVATAYSLSACFVHLCAALDPRSAPRWFVLLTGALFAQGRRAVTSWFRAAGITTDFRPAYHIRRATGQCAEHCPCPGSWPSSKHGCVAWPATTCSVLSMIHPTARYSPKAQGAGIHHNPTSGPASEKVGDGGGDPGAMADRGVIEQLFHDVQEV